MNRIISIGTPFILGVGAGLVIQGESWSSFLNSYIPALVTLLAAYYGAHYAFKFQSGKEEADLIRRNIVSINSSIFTLTRMANKLFIYQRDIINPVRSSPLFFLEMSPTIDMEKELIKLEIDSLYFLLETDHRNLLGEIMIEEERYRGAIEAINMRSKKHIRDVQPLLENAGVVPSEAHTLKEIERILGIRLFTTIKQSSEQVITHVDRTLISLKQVTDRLRDNIKKQYPETAIISFTLPKT